MGYIEKFDIVVRRRHDGHQFSERRVETDLDDTKDLRRHLVDIARAEDSLNSGEAWIVGYELEVHYPGRAWAKEPIQVLSWTEN